MRLPCSQVSRARHRTAAREMAAKFDHTKLHTFGLRGLSAAPSHGAVASELLKTRDQDDCCSERGSHTYK